METELTDEELDAACRRLQTLLQLETELESERHALGEIITSRQEYLSRYYDIMYEDHPEIRDEVDARVKQLDDTLYGAQRSAPFLLRSIRDES